MPAPRRKSKLILVERDRHSLETLQPLLEWANFETVLITEPRHTLPAILKGTPDIVVLSTALQGREILVEIRDEGLDVPVLMVGEGEAIERTLALEEGADAYLNKPFDIKEFIALIRAILRRTQQPPATLDTAHRLTAGDLVLDRLARRVWLSQEEITLTPKALALLEYFMTHPRLLLTRAHLLDAVWGWDYPAGERAVDTRIFELRKALSDQRQQPRFIETLPGQGYRFIAAVEIAG